MGFGLGRWRFERAEGEQASNGVKLTGATPHLRRHQRKEPERDPEQLD
jgi:hypothetical protein